MGGRRGFNPPLSQDIPERAFRTAWSWSKRLGLPTNRDTLEGLARLIPPGFTGHRPQDKAWVHILSRGYAPKRRLVKSFVFFARADDNRRQQRARAAVLAAHLDLDRLGPEVADWIGDYAQANGIGPLWREVGAAFGWDRVHTHAVITALCRAGWVSSTHQTRSLRPVEPQAPGHAVGTHAAARRRCAGRTVGRTVFLGTPSVRVHGHTTPARATAPSPQTSGPPDGGA